MLYFRVIDPAKAIGQVEEFLVAASQLAQTTLRSLLGKHELDDMLAERELQTPSNIAGDKTNTIVFPLPGENCWTRAHSGKKAD